MEKASFEKLKDFLPRIKRNVLLRNYASFKIGGKAKYFFEAKTKEDLIMAILAAKKNKLPFFILGGGSNLLVSDKGFNGIAVKMQNEKIKSRSLAKPNEARFAETTVSSHALRFARADEGKALSELQNYNTKCKINVEAGCLLSKLVRDSVFRSFTGLEWAVGIPGTVGGAIYGNAGSFGESMAEVVKRVEVFDINDYQFSNKSQNSICKIKTKFLKNKDCRFGYRESIFKKKKNLIILSAELVLRKGKKKEIEKKIKENLSYKRKNQPLNFPSAGSIFKNLELTLSNFQLLAKKFPEIKQFKKNRIVPAAWLIEKCNLKGKKIGQARISEKQANFILNLGKARSQEVKKLINLAKRKVKKKFGIELEEEVQYLGFKN